ncbi:Zn-ribbon domain-containing OB-fold protein [Nocardia grenadensis]|uniref:Zn-ribbon domain-containing OB-fold protein n=1 Tax=Nocardia grenadensis TaxID=931537 RepID=UPI003D730148
MTTTVNPGRSPVDPRPVGAETDGAVTITGWRCVSCAHPLTREVLRCPLCRGGVEPTTFATSGVVWASTCLRVRVPGYPPPFAVAYLTLDDGPRILVHTPGDSPVPPGRRATVIAVSPAGDLIATESEVRA